MPAVYWCAGSRMPSPTTTTRYNAAGQPLTSTQKQLISQLSPTLESKVISVSERGLTSTQWSVYNTDTKRIRYSSVPTSNITAEAVVVDGFALSQKDFSGIVTTATRQFTAEGILYTQTDGRGNTTTTATDIAGRTTRVTDAAGNTTSFPRMNNQPMNLPSKTICGLLKVIIAVLLSGCCMVISFWYLALLIQGKVPLEQGAGIFLSSLSGAVVFFFAGLIFLQHYCQRARTDCLMVMLIMEVFAVAGVGLGGHLIHSVRLHQELQERGLATEAFVFKHERERDYSSDDSFKYDSYACYRFTAADGRVYKGRTAFSLGEMKLPVSKAVDIREHPSEHLVYSIGSRLPILYLPEKPENHMVNTPIEQGSNLMTQAVLCLVAFGIVGYSLYHFGPESPKKRGRK